MKSCRTMLLNVNFYRILASSKIEIIENISADKRMIKKLAL